MRIETTILSQLIHNEDYCRKAIPFLKEEYFHEGNERFLYNTIAKHLDDYNTLPTTEILNITINQDVWEDKEQLFDDVIEYIEKLNKTDIDNNWLLDKTEEFCQEKSVYNAIMESIQIIDGKDKNNTKGAIPEILSKALSVSFDNHIGHDWIEDFSDRYDFYHKTEKRVPFDLEYMNLITKGGLPEKTLSCILAGTGVGKSLAMCHFAASNLMDSKKVLYITLEMAEERIAERIDANLLDVSLKELEDLPKTAYIKKVERIRDKTEGKLIIKEYPTATANTSHFKNLISELALKKSFKPDIVFVDYLNICTSSRFKSGSNVNSYTMIKAIAEELRGLAVEHDIPIFSATQTTRGGFVSSDVGLEDTSESFGLPATADFMFALISSEELEEKNQIMVKQLKNRYNDPTVNRKFILGVDRSKMRFYDVEQNAQTDLVDSGQETSSSNDKFKKLGQFSDFKM